MTAMSSVLSSLGPAEQQELLDDLNYLNLQEIRSLCGRYSILYRISVETTDGRTKPTMDTDRKPVILHRIRHYLATAEVLDATRLPAPIVRDDGPPTGLRPTDRLYYRGSRSQVSADRRADVDLSRARSCSG
jgi:hypothetical protein